MVKRKRELVLTKKQKEKIWGETGPYSEVYLTFETRILDDEATRIILKVHASINPLTFEIIKKHREYFESDKRVQDILEYGELRYDEFGYKAVLFSAPYDPDILEIANNILGEVEEAVIKMHKFVMNHFDINMN